jgi:sporulation protein YlmC with PRC-barrel domain
MPYSCSPCNEAGKIDQKENADPHLRSTLEVIGYHIQASDGEIGHVEDIIINDQDWTICYLVIDTHNWLPGKKVLVAPTWVKSVNWAQRKVYINLRRETIKECPEFDPSIALANEID